MHIFANPVTYISGKSRARLYYNIYITLYIGLPLQKVEGASHGSGDCSELFH